MKSLNNANLNCSCWAYGSTTCWQLQATSWRALHVHHAQGCPCHSATIDVHGPCLSLNHHNLIPTQARLNKRPPVHHEGWMNEGRMDEGWMNEGWMVCEQKSLF
jgi:hypothetical protein